MEKQTLAEMIDSILYQMKNVGFADGTCMLYRVAFNRLLKRAKERGDVYYNYELGASFINDDSHMIAENSKRYWHERTQMYNRCIRLIDMYLKDGVVDFSSEMPKREFPLKSKSFQELFQRYLEIMEERGLKPNTIDGYRRFVYYFFEYLESKCYESMDEVQAGDVVTFIAFVCREKYQPTSLCAHVPGLRLFFSTTDLFGHLANELPLHLPKKREILQVYSDVEYKRIIENLEKSEEISLRNKAITILAMETGLRAVDICNLKMSDIDWEHGYIHIVQEKTNHTHNLPLSENIGNALVDYLLNERPPVDSAYVFLRNTAPFNPLMTHAGIRNILFNAVNDADIENNDRVYGTRITRHSTASRMLRKGIPLSVIADALGHKNPNSVMIYITTDDAKLAECTLPLPNGGHIHE